MKKATYILCALMLTLSSSSSMEDRKARDVGPISQSYESYSIVLSSAFAIKPLSSTASVEEEPKNQEKVTESPVSRLNEDRKDETKQEPKGKKSIFEVTAYTAGPESTGKRKGDKGYGVTASGTKVKEGRTIACPKSMSFGTKIYVPSRETTYICEDRGGAIKEGRLDIYMENLKDALDFGRQKVEAVVLPKETI